MLTGISKKDCSGFGDSQTHPLLNCCLCCCGESGWTTPIILSKLLQNCIFGQLRVNASILFWRGIVITLKVVSISTLQMKLLKLVAMMLSTFQIFLRMPQNRKGTLNTLFLKKAEKFVKKNVHTFIGKVWSKLFAIQKSKGDFLWLHWFILN